MMESTHLFRCRVCLSFTQSAVKVQVVAGLGKGISKRFAAKAKGEMLCGVGKQDWLLIHDMMMISRQ